VRSCGAGHGDHDRTRVSEVRAVAVEERASDSVTVALDRFIEVHATVSSGLNDSDTSSYGERDGFKLSVADLNRVESTVSVSNLDLSEDDIAELEEVSGVEDGFGWALPQISAVSTLDSTHITFRRWSDANTTDTIVDHEDLTKNGSAMRPVPAIAVRIVTSYLLDIGTGLQNSQVSKVYE
jgi:hypothetical protein